MNGIKICGTGRGVPDTIVSNQDIAARVDTNDAWIVSRTGIRNRRHSTEGDTFQIGRAHV